MRTKFVTLFCFFSFAFCLQSQDLPQRWFYTSGDNELDLSTLINPVSRWTDTTQPYTIYNDGYMKFNGFAQHLSSGKQPFFDLVYSITDTFYFECEFNINVDTKISIPVGCLNTTTGIGWYISYYLSAAHEVAFYMTGKGYIVIDTLVYMGASTDTTIKRFGIGYSKANGDRFTTWRDGVLRRTYTGDTWGENITGTNFTLCVGNSAEYANATYYTESYSYAVTTHAWRGNIKSFTFSKNDTAYAYRLAQSNTQCIFPVKMIDGDTVIPYFPLESADRLGRDSTNAGSFILGNGAWLGKDSMDAQIFRSGGLKTNYRDCYTDMSSLQIFDVGQMVEGYGGEVFTYNGTLYAFGQFNVANGLTTSRGDWDSCKGVAKWNGSEWVQLGYGLAVGSGISETQSSTMYGFGYHEKIIACGYDTSAVGVGRINYVAQYDTATDTWSAMGSGLNNVAFSGASAYGLAYIGYYGDSAIGSAGKKRLIAKWNGSSWDSLKGGLSTGVPLCVFPDSSDGRKLIVGGTHTGFIQAGVTTDAIGLAQWNEDTDTWSKWNNLTINSGKGVFKILKHNDWYYIMGDFDWITDGTDTVRSIGMARWKSGTGLQAIGTGVNYPAIDYGCITAAVIVDDILYIGGSFSRVNGMLSHIFGAIDLTTGTVIDVGYGVDKRMEGLCEWEGDVIGLGDNFHANGEVHWIAFKYEASLNVP